MPLKQKIRLGAAAVIIAVIVWFVAYVPTMSRREEALKAIDSTAPRWICIITANSLQTEYAGYHSRHFITLGGVRYDSDEFAKIGRGSGYVLLVIPDQGKPRWTHLGLGEAHALGQRTGIALPGCRRPDPGAPRTEEPARTMGGAAPFFTSAPPPEPARVTGREPPSLAAMPAPSPERAEETDSNTGVPGPPVYHSPPIPLATGYAGSPTPIRIPLAPVLHVPAGRASSQGLTPSGSTSPTPAAPAAPIIAPRAPLPPPLRKPPRSRSGPSGSLRAKPAYTVASQERAGEDANMAFWRRAVGHALKRAAR